jgi:hypothetical protein
LVSFIDRVRAVWTTNSLVLFYDLAFLNKLLLDVEVRRAVTVGLSILLMGGSGVVYAIVYIFTKQDLLPYASVPILIGAMLFGASTWQRTVRIGFTAERTNAVLASVDSVFIDLNREELLPAFVERSLTIAQRYIAEGKIHKAQSCTDLAQGIWINTVLRQHANFSELQRAYANYVRQVRARTKSILTRRPSTGTSPPSPT